MENTIENTIENIIRFIFETETTPFQKWFEDAGLCVSWSMTALCGRNISDRCVNEISLIHHTNPVTTHTVAATGGFAFVFPKYPSYVELIIESTSDRISVGDLLPDNSNHKRYIERAMIAATVFCVFCHHKQFSREEMLKIDCLDICKPDDVFILNRIIDLWCEIGDAQFLMEYCDNLGLMEHKMLVMRGIHEYRKANGYDGKFEL